jgi:hypothetical protein
VFVSYERNHRITVFGADGRFLRKFGHEHIDGARWGFCPRGIALGAGDELFVADYRNDRSLVFSADGALLRSFGQHGVSDGQLYHPQGVAVSSATGDVFVVDYTGERLQQFGADVPSGGVGLARGRAALALPTSASRSMWPSGLPERLPWWTATTEWLSTATCDVHSRSRRDARSTVCVQARST